MSKKHKRNRLVYGSLNHSMILDAAELLIESEGLKKLSFRKIASEIGCGVMSLYKYFPNKDILLGALLDRRIESNCSYNHTNLSHEQWLTETFYSMYVELIREVDFIQLFCNFSYTGPASLQMVNTIHAKLIDEVGLTPEDSSRILHNILSLTNGAAMIHAANTSKNHSKTPYMNTFSDDFSWEENCPKVLATAESYSSYMYGTHIKKQIQDMAELLLKEVSYLAKAE